jgi:hypothetical protein
LLKTSAIYLTKKPKIIDEIIVTLSEIYLLNFSKKKQQKSETIIPTIKEMSSPYAVESIKRQIAIQKDLKNLLSSVK